MPSIIDLTYNIEPNMPVYPESKPPVITSVSSIEENGYVENEISLWSHTGTHIESEAHVIQHGKMLPDFDISHFSGNGLVIRCNSINYITDDLILKNTAGKEAFDVILFNTGWDKYWGQPDYFKNYPVLTEKACEVLNSLSLKALGFDTISVDPIDSHDLANHKALFRKEILIIENLCNLDKLPQSGFRVIFAPLKLDMAEASPVRAFATIDM